MPRSKEVPVEDYPRGSQPLGLSQGRSEGYYGALMSCAPNTTPELSQEELLPLREVIADAIDALPEKERFVVEAYFIERLSLRDLAPILGCGKSTVANMRDRAIRKLQTTLGESELVRERLQ